MAKSMLKALLPEIAETFQDNTKMQNIIKRLERSGSVTQNPLPNDLLS